MHIYFKFSHSYKVMDFITGPQEDQTAKLPTYYFLDHHTINALLNFLNLNVNYIFALYWVTFRQTKSDIWKDHKKFFTHLCIISLSIKNKNTSEIFKQDQSQEANDHIWLIIPNCFLIFGESLLLSHLLWQIILCANCILMRTVYRFTFCLILIGVCYCIYLFQMHL